MKRHQHADFQKITSTILKRVGKIGQQNLLDVILSQIVFPKGSGAPLASGSAAYFPSSGRVTYSSGDRSTGATVAIAAGVGIKRKASDPDDDVPLFEPIVLTAASSQVLSASDPTNDRIDRIFMRPKLVSENAQSVDIIDTMEVVSSSSEDQDERYDFEKVVATGTPAGSPTPPAVPGGWDAADEIAEILVQSGSGTIDASDITDKRTEFRVATDLESDTRAAAEITTAAPLPVSDVQTELERIDAKAGQTTASQTNQGAGITPIATGEILSKTFNYSARSGVTTVHVVCSGYVENTGNEFYDFDVEINLNGVKKSLTTKVKRAIGGITVDSGDTNFSTVAVFAVPASAGQKISWDVDTVRTSSNAEIKDCSMVILDLGA